MQLKKKKEKRNKACVCVMCVSRRIESAPVHKTRAALSREQSGRLFATAHSHTHSHTLCDGTDYDRHRDMEGGMAMDCKEQRTGQGRCTTSSTASLHTGHWIMTTLQPPSFLVCKIKRRGHQIRAPCSLLSTSATCTHSWTSEMDICPYRKGTKSEDRLRRNFCVSFLLSCLFVITPRYDLHFSMYVHQYT